MIMNHYTPIDSIKFKSGVRQWTIKFNLFKKTNDHSGLWRIIYMLLIMSIHKYFDDKEVKIYNKHISSNLDIIFLRKHYGLLFSY